MLNLEAAGNALHLSRASSSQLLGFTLILFFTFSLAYALYQRLFAPLARVRGPFWASLSPLWKLFAVSNGDFHEKIMELHQNYGPIVRIAPSEVIIADGSAIHEIYGTTNGRDFLKV
jgi:hypothetical protein